MSWKPEVEVDGKWCQNALVFATKAEAEKSAQDLFARWCLTTDCRSVEVDEPVNYALVDGKLIGVEEPVHG
jgi:hypothetical protein